MLHASIGKLAGLWYGGMMASRHVMLCGNVERRRFADRMLMSELNIYVCSNKYVHMYV